MLSEWELLDYKDKKTKSRKSSLLKLKLKTNSMKYFKKIFILSKLNGFSFNDTTWREVDEWSFQCIPSAFFLEEMEVVQKKPLSIRTTGMRKKILRYDR